MPIRLGRWLWSSWEKNNWLIKEKVNGTISTNVSGGQFITFRGDVCYESNKSGVGEIVIPSTPTPDPNTPTPVLQRQQHKCGLCGGSGRVIETNGISFGNTKWCSECGKTVPDYHYHTVCPSCKGKGWW